MRIICATDLLPKSESALDRAGMLANRIGAELTIVHVVSNAESTAMLDEEMQRAGARLVMRTRPPLWTHAAAPTILVRGGSPGRVLIETARELDASLVVLGVHRHRPASDALYGTIAESLLRNIDCPILVVRRMPLGAYREILVAVDPSAASGEAVRAAERLVLNAGAKASVVHGCSPNRTQEARARILELLANASADSSRYGLILEDSRTAVAALSNAVRRLNPELLVLGTRRRGRLHRALFASTASRVLTTRSSDLLVVPHPPEEATWRRRRFERESLGVVTGV